MNELIKLKKALSCVTACHAYISSGSDLMINEPVIHTKDGVVDGRFEAFKNSNGYMNINVVSLVRDQGFNSKPLPDNNSGLILERMFESRALHNQLSINIDNLRYFSTNLTGEKLLKLFYYCTNSETAHMDNCVVSFEATGRAGHVKVKSMFFPKPDAEPQIIFEDTINMFNVYSENSYLKLNTYQIARYRAAYPDDASFIHPQLADIDNADIELFCKKYGLTYEHVNAEQVVDCHAQTEELVEKYKTGKCDIREILREWEPLNRYGYSTVLIDENENGMYYIQVAPIPKVSIFEYCATPYLNEVYGMLAPLFEEDYSREQILEAYKKLAPNSTLRFSLEQDLQPDKIIIHKLAIAHEVIARNGKVECY